MTEAERTALDRLITEKLDERDWTEMHVMRAAELAVQFERAACAAIVKAAQQAKRDLFDVYNEINARGQYWQVGEHFLRRSAR